MGAERSEAPASIYLNELFKSVISQNRAFKKFNMAATLKIVRFQIIHIQGVPKPNVIL